MGEERLLEIVTRIDNSRGVLELARYLVDELSQSDFYLFSNYVKGSKYAESSDFFNAAIKFSRNYLRNKNRRTIVTEDANLGDEKGEAIVGSLDRASSRYFQESGTNRTIFEDVSEYFV